MFISNSTNVRLADVVSLNHRVVINSFIGNFLQTSFVSRTVRDQFSIRLPRKSAKMIDGVSATKNNSRIFVNRQRVWIEKFALKIGRTF